MTEMTTTATIDAVDAVLTFVADTLRANGCPERNISKLCICVEELYVNVAHYAYPPKTGKAVISCDVLENPRRAVLTIKDTGTPYNPLKKEDPDITADIESRPIGGLGIFIVKQTVDEMTYDFVDGQNIVTIVKNF